MAEASVLTRSIMSVPGIGARKAEGFRTLGLTNIGKLIAHLPHRHQREAGEGVIADLVEGVVGTARGEVGACRAVRTGRVSRFEAALLDDSGRVDLVFFNQAFLAKKIHAGDRLRVQGTPKARGGGLQIANPRFELLDEDGDDPEPEATGERLRPIYPASERVASADIERAVSEVLCDALEEIDDHLTEAYCGERELPRLAETYRMMHAPEDESEVADARRRLAYDELLLMQLAVHRRRADIRRLFRAPELDTADTIHERILSRLPFELTKAQARVVQDLRGDLAKVHPANRLIQGDVGSGKTAVALYAMLLAVAEGHQAALMAPTEILAEQHAASIGRMLEGSRVRTALLTGASAERTATLRDLEAGEIDLVIGTHALIGERVRFSSLAVAVVDEQHRFGVRQRAVLRTGAEAGRVPHTLVMTATPIPRTVSMTLYGDLDVITIDSLPPGRTPIETELIPLAGRTAAYADVRDRIGRGERAYVVVPAIDSEQLRDVERVREELSEHYLPDARIGVVHGRLPRGEREFVMDAFRDGRLDVLIATTVIEVGVDVPEASAIVIEHAERFGIAQLHQLRGRVGRGSAASKCWLLGDAETEDAKERLEAVAATSDGFKLAEADLRIRGMGELFGTKQSGMAPFKIADPMKDRELLNLARRDAAAWIERSPGLDAPEEAVLWRRLKRAHGAWLELGDVG
ncbi:MAG: ATP-dependent DNA helicase RecG [Planctomycetota bacterium]